MTAAAAAAHTSGELRFVDARAREGGKAPSVAARWHEEEGGGEKRCGLAWWFQDGVLGAASEWLATCEAHSVQ
eukprot:364183-Chlamydomonas_euryale.AAC.14